MKQYFSGSNWHASSMHARVRCQHVCLPMKGVSAKWISAEGQANYMPADADRMTHVHEHAKSGGMDCQAPLT